MDIPSMILVSICFSALTRINALQPTILFQILLELLFWRMEHKYRKRFSTFSLATFNNKSMFLSPNMAFEP
jgi:hypothetical protein